MKFDEAPLAACSAGKAAVEVTTGSQRSRRKAQSLSQSLSLRMIRAARRMRKRNISADDPADADRNILKVALSEAVRVCVCVRLCVSQRQSTANTSSTRPTGSAESVYKDSPTLQVWTDGDAWSKVSWHVTIRGVIQDAMVASRDERTPIEVLNSLSLFYGSEILAQLTRTLIMKSWRHTEDGFRQRHAQSDAGRTR